MAAKRRFGRTLRWTWAIAAAVVFHLALYWSVGFTRDSNQKLKRQTRQFTEIQYFDTETIERSEVMRQRMTLFDPRPLLLPTRWNAANAHSLADYWQEEGNIFSPFPLMFELEDGNYIDDFGNVPANYDRLTVAQTEFAFTPYRQLGRVEAEQGFELESGLQLTVREIDRGTGLISTNIYNEATQDLEASWPEMRPAVFLATVKDSFPSAGLSVIESSGFDEADRRLSGIVAAAFSRVATLKDGVYLLEIVP